MSFSLFQLNQNDTKNGLPHNQIQLVNLNLTFWKSFLRRYGAFQKLIVYLYDRNNKQEIDIVSMCWIVQNISPKYQEESLLPLKKLQNPLFTISHSNVQSTQSLVILSSRIEFPR